MRTSQPPANDDSNALRDWKRLFIFSYQSLKLDTVGRVRFLFALSIVIAGVESFSLAATPYFFSRAVDVLSKNSVSQTGLILVLISISCLLASKVARELGWLVYYPAETQWTNAIQLRYLDHVLNLPLQQHLESSTGHFDAVLGNGLGALRMILSGIVTNALPLLFELTSALIIFGAVVSWDLGALLTITILVYFALLFWAGEIVAKRQAVAIKLAIDSQSSSTDMLLNAEGIKTNAIERAILERYDRLIHQVAAAFNLFFYARGTLGISLISVLITGFATITFLALGRFQTGQLTLGQLVLTNSYLISLFRPLEITGFNYRQIRQSLVSLQPFMYIFEIDTEQKTGISVAIHKAPLVELQNVSFHFDEKRELLKNLSATFAPSQITALKGASGSGKSTIVRLLVRLLSPTSGTVSINKANIENLPLSQLRSFISVVQQDALILDEGLAFNIALDDKADEKRLNNIIHLCKLDSVVIRLNNDFNAPVGERGRKLSGGERQRLAIARALYREPLVLVLDEATTALDAENEAAIFSILQSIKENLSIILISHNTEHVRMADAVVDLDRLSEDGQERTIFLNSIRKSE
ncbi:ABC transporter ATP-binding protein [Brucella sp. NBRC 12950]|uniref:ABC transporter ATP-binding protein n=1 Tax=Brucella sp. NBRC 12950 TaxID=2994518 RepID=UPI0024A2B3FB|nr:ABC transporter ATP-binding protein [Brucella sp. NBRC 12950]GLU27563.1 ABC transport protein [Brucella sp. NBRC 12950]